jgi:hypothetical protein
VIEGQEEQLARDEFERVYSREVKEKQADIVGFPSSGPIPTYAVAFGKNEYSDNAKKVDATSRRSLSTYSYSSEGGVGSPLHDHEFLGNGANLPPRFQMQHGYQATDGNPFNPYASFAQPQPAAPQPTAQWGLPARAQGLQATMGGQGVVRNITASSTDSSESDPFHLDGEKRDKRTSVLSGNSERTLTSTMSPPKKTYVSPGSHHAANVLHKQTPTHTRDGSQASWQVKKGWVIE